jgi:hypothetical protein
MAHVEALLKNVEQMAKGLHALNTELVAAQKAESAGPPEDTVKRYRVTAHGVPWPFGANDEYKLPYAWAGHHGWPRMEFKATGGEPDTATHDLTESELRDIKQDRQIIIDRVETLDVEAEAKRRVEQEQLDLLALAEKHGMELVPRKAPQQQQPKQGQQQQPQR